jgi:hypothetical protein
LEGSFDFYRFFTQMDRENIVFAYRGDVTEELLSLIFQEMDHKFDDEVMDRRFRKKFNYICIECLQNVYRHMQHSFDLSNNTGAMFIICRDKAESYRIITGNYIENGQVDIFRQKIDKINNMNDEELKTHYRDTLSHTQLSEKGGAGLGMIEIARKSGHKLDYRFDKIDENLSFFTLKVKIT